MALSMNVVLCMSVQDCVFEGEGKIFKVGVPILLG